MSDHPAPGGAQLPFRNEDAGDNLFINNLFDSERGQIFSTRNLDRHAPFREDSFNWILERHGHYRFSPATAHSAVAYFDQFMSTYTVPAPEADAWRYRLLATACLLVAAKEEEADVPDVVDLQGPVQSFLAETVQNMESVVMARLQMRLRRVTPFDFRDYFISRLPPPPPADNIAVAFADLVMNTIRAGAFLRFLPSEVAAAAVILAAGCTVELPNAFYGRVNRETERRCRQQLEWYAVHVAPLAAPVAFPPLADPPAVVLPAAPPAVAPPVAPVVVAPPAATVVLALPAAPVAVNDSTTGDTGSRAREDNKPEGPVKKRRRSRKR